MNKHLRTAIPILLFSLLLFGCEQSSQVVGPELESLEAETGSMEVTLGKQELPDYVNVGDLIAGQTEVVGQVSITVDGGNLIVTYNVDFPWCLTETHLYVGDNDGTLPPGVADKGKGIPGQYPYKDASIVDCGASYTISNPDISSGGNHDGMIIVSAHGVVEAPEDVTTLDGLPSMGFLNNLLRGIDPGDSVIDSYFNGLIADADGLNGPWDLWCIDRDRTITQGNPYKVFFYSSYDPNIADQLDADDLPENLPKVNWILNQDFISQGYTYGQIQKAIWRLIDPAGLNFEATLHEDGTTNNAAFNAKVQEIVDMANEHGDFVPGCGERVAIVVVPYNWDGEVMGAKRQILILSIPVPCGEETAWAYGAVQGVSASDITSFTKAWGWYFKYTF